MEPAPGLICQSVRVFFALILEIILGTTIFTVQKKAFRDEVDE
jgi:hypothetical protein